MTQELLSASFLTDQSVKIIVAFLIMVILAPAVILACHCCPSVPHDGTLSIGKAPCHSCCPGTQIASRESGSLNGKMEFLQLPRDMTAVLGMHMAQTSFAAQIEEKNSSEFQTSPLARQPFLSTVLRI